MKKKILKSLGSVMAIAILALVAVSCGQKLPDAQAVAEKLQTNQTLNEADYTAIIDYCGEYAKKVQPFFNEINAESDSVSAKSSDATEKMAAVFAEFPYLDLFRNAMYGATAEQLGEKNIEKVKEYADLEAFPIPENMAPELVPSDVVGDIEQMPASDTTGVIAGGAGEAVDMKVKD